MLTRLLNPAATCSRHIATSAAVFGRDKSRPKSISEYRQTDSGTVDVLNKKLRGERSFEWSDGMRDAEYMPTLETHKQKFNGIVYDDIPICHVRATKNNTIIRFTDASHNFITGTSARQEGFKNARKKTEVAAQTTGMAAGVRAMRRGIHTVRVKVQGLGHGRTAGPKGMVLSGLNIVSLTDYTEIRDTYKRPKKARRI